MPSLRSRMFVFALRNRHLLRFQLKRRSAITWDTSIPDLRRETERGSGLMGKLPKDVTASAADANGVPAEWIVPEGSPEDKVIFYFHGGGYAIGSCRGHRPIVSKFARGSGTRALVFDYRLAPEHPYPAALDDAVAAYTWLLEQGLEARSIVCMGDSAGGGLCLACLLALRDKGRPLPAGAAVMSPWTDLRNSGESWESNAEVDTLCWREAQTVFAKYYAGDSDPGLPWMSPLYGDLAGLPPLLIHVGGDELLLSDSTRFAEKAEAAGVDVTLRIGEGMFHCYPACAPLFPEATQALEDICGFVEERVDG